MHWRARVDRIWLWLIGIAFVVVVPVLLILKIQDFGAWNVGLFVLMLLLIGLYRGWPTDR